MAPGSPAAGPGGVDRVDGPSSFAEVLRQHRHAHGLTQAELAERAGLSERAISDLERGLKSPHRATIQLLVKSLALRPEDAEHFEAAARSRLHSVETPSSTAKHNLPATLTSFVGREEAIADLQQLLHPETDGPTAPRLVTLTGAGGCGKTRLGLELARGLVHAFPDGVWFVDLAPITDDGLVVHTILSALGGREAPGKTPLESVLRSVQGRVVLVVLDNCEHLVQICAELATGLLTATTSLRILATSRELLRVPGEAAWRVPSLAVPESGQVLDPERLVQFEAVRLFVDRIQLLQPRFALTAANAPAVVQVCSQLDGIPLAIELAAARGATMAVQEIAARLHDRFRLLTGGSRVALPRHRTLHATVDWSFDLLSPSERALFRRLAVFAGGWTLEASEVVCGWQPLAPDEVLDLLTRLVDRSLVGVHQQDGRTRYRFLETVRVYAAERLHESGETNVVRARHLDWCLAFAERAAIELGRQDQVAWFRRLVAEHDNIRAALEVSRANVDGAGSELRLAAAMGQFWRLQYPSEGRHRLAEVLAQASPAPSSVRAAALVWQASIETLFGDPAAGRALARESLLNARAVGDTGRAAHALRQLAMSSSEADATGRVALLEEGLTLARLAGADGEAAMLLAYLAAAAAEAGDLERVRVLLEEGELLARRSGDAWGWVQPLAQLGWLAIGESRLAEAEAHFRKALDLAEGIGYVAAAALSLVGLGQVALRRGKLELARELHCQGLLAQREAGGAYLASGLAYLASVEAAAEQHDRAQRLMGASEAWHAVRGGALEVWLPWTHGPLRRGLVPLPGVPTDPLLVQARAEGRAMTLDEAVASALRAPDPMPSAARVLR